jgi:chaperone required for assembly of F1-ATPase
MPLTRLVCTALDRVAERMDEVVDEVVRYAETDLLCYRAERPTELAQRQRAAWQPLLDWATQRYGASLAVTTGLTPLPQDPGPIGALRAAVAKLDALSLTGLHAATAASGSLVIGLALLEREIDADSAWRASQIDETYQMESWGEDPDAAAQRESLHQDLLAAARFMTLCRA